MRAGARQGKGDFGKDAPMRMAKHLRGLDEARRSLEKNAARGDIDIRIEGERHDENTRRPRSGYRERDNRRGFASP